MSKVRTRTPEAEERRWSPWQALGAIATAIGVIVTVLIYLDSRKSDSVIPTPSAPDPIGFQLIEPKPEGPILVAGCVPVAFKGTPPAGNDFFVGVWTPADNGYWFNPEVIKEGGHWIATATLGADGFGMGDDYQIVIFLGGRPAIEDAWNSAEMKVGADWFAASAPADSRELVRIDRKRSSEPKMNC